QSTDCRSTSGLARHSIKILHAQARVLSSPRRNTHHAKNDYSFMSSSIALDYRGDSMKTSMALLLAILVMGAISCGPTTDTVVAPFELTSDFTSSTSPGDSAHTGPAKAHQRLDQYVAYAYDSVSSDIAQGHGEYLTSLIVLAGIPTNSQAAFRKEMQSRYAVIYDPFLSRKETQRLVVNYAWSAGYGRTEDNTILPQRVVHE
ncbi:MAG: DUF3015 domain-containing protein, partial [Nitrospira sp.]|nr:DUF3015 domain-containing protein [Nitrospira sp.]